jgi:hypothetical protein
MRAMDHHPMAPGESRLTARLTCLETRLVKGSSQLSKSGLVFCPKSKVTSSMLGPVSTLLPSLVTQWCLCLILILKTWTSSKGFVFASWEDHLSFFLDCLMLDLTEGPVPWSSWHIAMVTTGKRLCLSSSLLTQAPLLHRPPSLDGAQSVFALFLYSRPHVQLKKCENFRWRKHPCSPLNVRWCQQYGFTAMPLGAICVCGRQNLSFN